MKISATMIYGPLLLVSTTLLVLPVASQFAGCDFSEQLSPGQTRDIFSPNYPNPYRGQVNCRWTATAPVGTTFQLQCTDVNLPTSVNCAGDRLLVSRNGRQDLLGATAYCGANGFTVESVGNRMVIAIRTQAQSRGGRILCRLRVQQPCQCGMRNGRALQSRMAGNATTRIVGGVETGVNEFPMMAGLIDLQSRNLHCGATLISNRHALTAAHCLMKHSSSSLALLVGDHDLSTGTDTSLAAIYTLTRLLNHPGFKLDSQVNDIALVVTASTISFNYGVSPACLPFSPMATNSFAGDQVQALGWGTTDFGGPKSQRLKRVALDVITNVACRRTFTNLQASHICTYSMGRDMCQYDSGGPLLWTNPRTGQLVLVGISSYGLACAGVSPGVNTRVASYLSWIQQNTAGTELCRPVAA